MDVTCFRNERIAQIEQMGIDQIANIKKMRAERARLLDTGLWIIALSFDR